MKDGRRPRALWPRILAGGPADRTTSGSQTAQSPLASGSALTRSQNRRSRSSSEKEIVAECLARETDHELRKTIFVALAKIGAGAKEAVRELTNLLDDSEPDLRIEAAATLGAIGPEAKAGVPKLILALEDPKAPE